MCKFLIYPLLALIFISCKIKSYTYIDSFRKEYYLDFEKNVFMYKKSRPNMSLNSGDIEISEGKIIQLSKKEFILKSIERQDVTNEHVLYIMIDDTIKFNSYKSFVISNKEDALFRKGNHIANPYQTIGVKNKVGIDW